MPNGTTIPAPEYVPPPPPPPLNEETLLNDNYRLNEDNKFAGEWNATARNEWHNNADNSQHGVSFRLKCSPSV